MSRASFEDAFMSLTAGDSGSDEDSALLSVIKDNLFEIFDTNGDGSVDFVELCSGLTVLCGGTMEAKGALCNFAQELFPLSVFTLPWAIVTSYSLPFASKIS